MGLLSKAEDINRAYEEEDFTEDEHEDEEEYEDLPPPEKPKYKEKKGILSRIFSKKTERKGSVKAEEPQEKTGVKQEESSEKEETAEDSLEKAKEEDKPKEEEAAKKTEEDENKRNTDALLQIKRRIDHEARERHHSINDMEKELEEKALLLAEREGEIKKQEKEINDLKKKLKKKINKFGLSEFLVDQEEIEKRERAVKKREEELGKKEEELKRREGRLESIEERISLKEAELMEREEKISEKEEELKRTEEGTSAKVSDLRLDVDELEKKIEDKEKRLDALEKLYKEKREEMKKDERKIKKEEEELLKVVNRITPNNPQEESRESKEGAPSKPASVPLKKTAAKQDDKIKSSIKEMSSIINNLSEGDKIELIKQNIHEKLRERDIVGAESLLKELNRIYRKGEMGKDEKKMFYYDLMRIKTDVELAKVE